MENLPASAGWSWIKQGFALLRKRPVELSTLLLSYLFFSTIASIIPLIGQALPILLMPVFSMAFMQACLSVEKDERVSPTLFFRCLAARESRPLLKLGGVYLLVLVASTFASSLVDGGLYWKALTGQLQVSLKEMHDSKMSMAAFFAVAVFLPVPIALWFVAPLMRWQAMGFGKAVFYSVVLVARNFAAFVLYLLAWIGIYMLLSFTLSLIAIASGQLALALLLLIPLLMLMMAAIFCSFYPSYVGIFGRPVVPVADPPLDAPPTP
ncbi:BPSS1780 family membrane protein [soil metagenome]